VKLASEQRFTALVGIDWSDRKHDFCLQAAGSKQRESGVLAHSPEAITRWATGLHRRFGGPIAVCLELAKGPLVHALQRHEFIVLFPVNPATLAKYREAFVPSRAKDDRSDAEIALELLLCHREKLQRLIPQSADMRALATLVEQRRHLVDDKTRITNRLTSTLKEYFPQALDWFEDRDTVLFCDFLQRWPSLKHVKRARPATLRSFFWAHNLRRERLIEQRIRGIRCATALTEDAAVIGPHQLLVEALIAQLRATLQAIDRFDAAITAVATHVPDYALFAALPGAGSILAPRLLVAFGEQRERYASAAELQRYAGVAPVLERSGNKSWVHWRLACPTFLRQTFVEWAASSIPRSFWASAYYHRQRAKGCSHQAALRALAFKWIRIVYRCWQTRTPYDEALYLHALKRRGSSLITTSAAPQNP
jgi:transposase